MYVQFEEASQPHAIKIPALEFITACAERLGGHKNKGLIFLSVLRTALNKFIKSSINRTVLSKLTECTARVKMKNDCSIFKVTEFESSSVSIFSSVPQIIVWTIASHFVCSKDCVIENSIIF